MEILLQDRFQEKYIVQQDTTYTIDVQSCATGFMMMEIDTGCTSLDLQIHAQESANTRVFIYNHAQNDVQLNIQISQEQDSNLEMGLLDIEKHQFVWNHHVDLKETGAYFKILSGQLCHEQGKKSCDMEVCHEASHTQGIMNHFAVLLDKGQFEMVANGNILKNCKEAQSHQATRVLTLGKDHSAKVIPLLLIDENEVKASHALTIGQPDADQLYYLQSRGLTYKQALGLLSIGYFLPVIEMIEDEDLKQQLQETMESQVGLYGNQ